MGIGAHHRARKPKYWKPYNMTWPIRALSNKDYYDSQHQHISINFVKYHKEINLAILARLTGLLEDAYTRIFFLEIETYCIDQHA